MHFNQHFPDSFDFYHLGLVEKQLPQAEEPLDQAPTPESRIGFAFEVKGESRAWIVVLFDSKMDPSVCSEMGNVLASRFADRMSASEGGRVWISPPRSLAGARLTAMLEELTKRGTKTTYLHQIPEGWAEVEAWVLTAPWEGAADV